LDHIVGGGVPAGLSPGETLLKEGGEEAGLPEDLTAQAVHRGIIAYTMDRAEGLRRDRLHCYDLTLPESFEPHPVDGEVAGFALWPIQRVFDAVRDTDEFKFNVNLVLIDLFQRLGYFPG
jgi:8-oxo-dGTP pyrophosphatase MutT (NUDIX family)